MKVAGEYTFEASQAVVWQALQDPAVIASVMPGCEKLELVGENQYEGVLNIKIGPVQGRFKGKIRLEDIVEPDSYIMHVDGRGAPGFVKAAANVALATAGDGTRMTYDSDAQVGGRLASVGQRLIDSSAKAIIKQSLDGLNQVMVARAASAGSAGASDGDGEAEPVSIEAPSQAEFAANIAKEVAKDLLPGGPVVWIVAAVALLAMLYFVLR